MIEEGGKRPSCIETIRNVYKNEGGLLGFYKGWLPPFIGSIIFRSVQFSVYEMCFTKFEEFDQLKK